MLNLPAVAELIQHPRILDYRLRIVEKAKL